MGGILYSIFKDGLSAILKTSSQVVVSSIEHSYQKELAANKFESDKLLEVQKLIGTKHLQNSQYEYDKQLEEIKFKNTRVLNKEIIDRTHYARLKEQRDYFLCLKGQMDYKFFLTHSWPLINTPEMILLTRQHNNFTSRQIPILIICTGCSQNIAIIIESAINKLNQVLNSINGNLNSQEQRTILYTGGWRTDKNFSQLSGRAVLDTLSYALKGYPTLVLQPIYYKVENKISIDASFWGLGSKEPMISQKILDVFYQETMSQEETLSVINKITSGLAIISIAISDMYHFLEYNSMPQFQHLLKHKDIYSGSLISMDDGILTAKQTFLSWSRLNNGRNLILTPEVGASFLYECAYLENPENKVWSVEEANDLLNKNVPFRELFKSNTTHDILFNELDKNYSLIAILNKLAKKYNLNTDSDIIQAWNFFIEKSSLSE